MILIEYSKLLERQIKKHFPTSNTSDDPGMVAFLNDVNKTYLSFDREKSRSKKANKNNEKKYIEINNSLNKKIEQTLSSKSSLKKITNKVTIAPQNTNGIDLISMSNYITKIIENSKKEREIYTSIINNVQKGVLLKDIDGNIFYVNEIFCELFDIKEQPKNIINKKFYKIKDRILLALKDSKEFIDKDKNTIKRGKQYNIVELKNGKNLEQNYMPIFKEAICLGYLWIYNDISETKEKEEALHKNEQQLNSSQEIAHIGSWEYNILDKKMEWTKEIYSIRGIDPQTNEANYLLFINGIHPEDRLMVNAKLLEAINNAISFNIHYRIIKPDGGIRILNDIGNPFINTEGKVIFIRGTLQDVTLKKKIEEEILQQKKFTEDILNNIPADIAVFDKNHNYLFINQKAIADIKIRNWLIGKNDFDYCKLKGTNTIIASKRREFFNETITTKKNCDFVDEHTRKDGELSFIYRRYHPYFEKNELKFVIGYGIDISSKRKTEIELEGMMKSMSMVNKELEQFAFSASHDLQEPLRMVTSFLSQLDKKYGTLLDERGRTYLNFATDGAKRMRQMILDLLEYSRVDRLNDFELEEVDLNEIIEDVIKLYKIKIKEKSANIVVDTLPKLKIHKTNIRQVFQSFIDNSLKYSKQNVPAEISISCAENTNNWQFSITDNGIGINSEYFEKIFVLFQRLHNRDKYSGTGIGLSIVKKIIYNMNGEIWLESQENIGTTFHFTIIKENKK